MAFLDETGLAELWKLIQDEDADVAALVNTKAKIVTGSYAGTGASGYTRTITIGFKPKFVMVSIASLNVSRDGSQGFVIWHDGVSGFYVCEGNGSALIRTTPLDAGFTINNASSNAVFNVSGTTYYYVAIG